jgi:hypothetical protein
MRARLAADDDAPTSMIAASMVWNVGVPPDRCSSFIVVSQARIVIGSREGCATASQYLSRGAREFLLEALGWAAGSVARIPDPARDGC